MIWYDVLVSAALWRKRAEEMRTIGEDYRDPNVRAMVLRIAADFDRLARYEEEREAGNPIKSRIGSDPVPLEPDAADEEEG